MAYRKITYPIIQKAVLDTINQPTFSAALPPLSDESWLKILGASSSVLYENDRLEFLGDALMYATLGLQLYSQLATGDPGLFTCIRDALHSNVTFSRLAEKLDILAVSDQVLRALSSKTFGEGNNVPLKTRGEVKATADLFETIIGVYCLEAGFDKLYEWVFDLYKPLVEVARDAYINRCLVILGKSPRICPPGVADCQPARNFFRPLGSRSIPQRADRNHDPIPTSSHRESRRLKSSRSRSSPIIIDLTLDSEDDDTPTIVDGPGKKASIICCSPATLSLGIAQEAGPPLITACNPAFASGGPGSLVSPSTSGDVTGELGSQDMLLESSSDMLLELGSDMLLESVSDMDVDEPSDSSSDAEGSADDDKDPLDSVPLLYIID